MAQVSTPAPVTEKPGPATSGVFTLTDEHNAAVDAITSRGREQLPSKYLTAVAEALKTGERRGIELKGADVNELEKHARKVGHELRKGALQVAKTMGLQDEVIKIETKKRLDHPKLPPFLAFTAQRIAVEHVTAASTAQA